MYSRYRGEKKKKKERGAFNKRPEGKNDIDRVSPLAGGMGEVDFHS